MVVTCCKTTSGAGAVWMAIPLRGRARLPAMKNGDRLKVILPNSHFTRALRSSWKNASLRNSSALQKVECKVPGSIPTDD